MWMDVNWFVAGVCVYVNVCLCMCVWYAVYAKIRWMAQRNKAKTSGKFPVTTNKTVCFLLWRRVNQVISNFINIWLFDRHFRNSHSQPNPNRIQICPYLIIKLCTFVKMKHCYWATMLDDLIINNLIVSLFIHLPERMKFFGVHHQRFLVNCLRFVLFWMFWWWLFRMDFPNGIRMDCLFVCFIQVGCGILIGMMCTKRSL